MATCKDCRFASAAEEIAPGVNAHTCRRYAPQPGPEIGSACWPHVLATDWCGEFSLTVPKVEEIVEAARRK